MTSDPRKSSPFILILLNFILLTLTLLTFTHIPINSMSIFSKFKVKKNEDNTPTSIRQRIKRFFISGPQKQQKSFYEYSNLYLSLTRIGYHEMKRDPSPNITAKDIYEVSGETEFKNPEAAEFARDYIMKYYRKGEIMYLAKKYQAYVEKVKIDNEANISGIKKLHTKITNYFHKSKPKPKKTKLQRKWAKQAVKERKKFEKFKNYCLEIFQQKTTMLRRLIDEDTRAYELGIKVERDQFLKTILNDQGLLEFHLHHIQDPPLK